MLRRLLEQRSGDAKSEMRAMSPARMPVVFAVATLLGGIFLAEDIPVIANNPVFAAQAAPFLTVPAVSTSEAHAKQMAQVLGETQKLFSASDDSRFILQSFFDLPANGESRTFLVGPELLQKLAPVITALQKQEPGRARFIVVLPENDARAAAMAKLVSELNRSLPKTAPILLKDPLRVSALIRGDVLKGLGLGETDAALLRRLIPDYQALTELDLSRLSGQVPGLTALLERFAHLSQVEASA